MSTVVNPAMVSLPTPQSSKKRKIDIDSPTKSKKKRKHTDLQVNGDSKLATASQASTVSETKTKDRKKKSKDTGSIVPTQESKVEDIELPDAPMVDDAPANDEQAVISIQPDVEDNTDIIQEVDETIFKSRDPSCFYSKRISLYVSVPAVALASSRSSLLSLHLAPLLLTYFPPADGIVLSFSDPVLSAQPDTGVNLPLRCPKNGEIPRSPPEEKFAQCADEFGVCWVWLTTTMLVFRPERGDELKGWKNVQSEGFIGLVSYNYFQTAVGKTRIPKAWNWDGPTRDSHKNRRTKKSKLRDGTNDSNHGDHVVSSQVEGTREDEAIGGSSGSFLDENGSKIDELQTYKVVDVEIVPGHERDRWTLQVDGSLLSQQEEDVVVAEERQKFETIQKGGRPHSETAGAEDDYMPLMSGGLAMSRATSVV